MLQNQMSNFAGPNAFPNGVAINNLAVLNTYPGNVFWVDSVYGSDGNEGTFNAAFGTVAYALTKVAANRGDLILVKAGHVETVAVAGGWAAAIAGCAVVGVAQGATRPKITFSTAASSVLITAASVRIQNIIGIAGAVNTNPFHVQAADCSLDIEWWDTTATTAEAQRVVLTTAAADRLSVNVKHIGLAGSTATVNSVRLVGVDTAKVYVDFYGVASTAVVEFTTTASKNIEVGGVFCNLGTALAKSIVDTITGSVWAATGCFDVVGGYAFGGGSGSALAAASVPAIAASLNVPAPDSAANALSRDVVGNKSDAAVTTVGITASILAYLKGILSWQVVPATDAVTNASVRDVVGSKADAAVTTASATASVIAYLKALVTYGDRDATSATAVMINGNTIFTVSGDIQVISLLSECITNNDVTASTVQYQSVPTIGAAATFSAASASLASALAGATLALKADALTDPPTLSASGPNIGIARPMFIPAGTIKIVVGVGSTVGTWKHYIRYRPLELGATVA